MVVRVAGFVIASCPLLVNLYRRNARRKPTLLVQSPSKIGGGRPRKAPFTAAAGTAIGAGAGAINAGAAAAAINAGAAAATAGAV